MVCKFICNHWREDNADRHFRSPWRPAAAPVGLSPLDRRISQYVARPPERSNTAPVENEHSSLASQQTIAAISSTPPKRPSGIFDSMKSMCCCEIWSKIAVRTAAGVTQLTRMPVFASSLPNDLVSPITPAFDALYADAVGLPSLPAIDAMLTMRP